MCRDLMAEMRRFSTVDLHGRSLGRGLHSSTFELNVSAFCGAGVCSGVVSRVYRGRQGVLGSI